MYIYVACRLVSVFSFPCTALSVALSITPPWPICWPTRSSPHVEVYIYSSSIDYGKPTVSVYPDTDSDSDGARFVGLLHGPGLPPALLHCCRGYDPFCTTLTVTLRINRVYRGSNGIILGKRYICLLICEERIRT